MILLPPITVKDKVLEVETPLPNKLRVLLSFRLIERPLQTQIPALPRMKYSRSSFD